MNVTVTSFSLNNIKRSSKREYNNGSPPIILKCENFSGNIHNKFSIVSKDSSLMSSCLFAKLYDGLGGGLSLSPLLGSSFL